ncbi:fatty acyl-CoA reductase wat-like isoform X2 [Aphidius gifuensis]|uniref:fatty acyl-CoA reductase wat-like isoform X2 n=1 Tax=Aphidius gifuensis TaxID=684658 RepID=UPI001CDB6472|nr:fatty acyl-CoA reductase wat-like isoform X2 [Aphidius gifuensis]
MDEIYDKISDPDLWGVDDSEVSEIQNFYANKTIFFTGCTGFFGKSIIEKLLRACPKLKKIYLFVRPKKLSSKERIEKYFNDTIFDKIRELQPKFTSKVVIIEGNLESPNLGLSDDDKNIIINEASIFIHNASNVKFDIRVSQSLNCNVIGTKNMLDLATQCKHLEVFVYVSTAFSHCYEKHIYEKCYPPPCDMNMIYDLIDNDRAHTNGLSKTAITELTAPWPNIYAFSKAMAENLVEQYAKKILPSFQEPTSGWTDGNLNGPVVISIGTGLGLLHLGPSPLNNSLDMVPVDMCTNALISTTWATVTDKNKSDQVSVYNYASSVVNPISLIQLGELGYAQGIDFPSNKMVGPLYFCSTNWYTLFFIGSIFLLLIPGIIGDIVLLLCGKKPLALSVARRAIPLIPDILYFSLLNNWRIHVHETTKVWDKMNKRDSELFFNDLRKLDWSIFCCYYWPSCRKYILKEPLSTLKQAKKRFFILQSAGKIFVIGVICLILYIFSNYLSLLLIPFINLIKLLNFFITKN